MDDMLNNNEAVGLDDPAEPQTPAIEDQPTDGEVVTASSAGGTDETPTTEGDTGNGESGETGNGNADNNPDGNGTADDASLGRRKPQREVALIDKQIGENIILYGVPGCGKSHTIKMNFCKDDKYIMRVVFHPDYTYSDFVGQILPESDAAAKIITYPFKPGPFTEILKQAHDDSDNMYYLIVEEINRGNAPAIFGDLFQLLDRDDTGVSEYEVYNTDMADHIYGDKTHGIRIPANLTILATMNTADQNVFTLDTAFKRRWRMCSIKNDVTKCDHGDKTICGTEVTWESFVLAMNELIIKYSEGGLSNEDKRLGAYFIKETDLNRVQLFAEKVLMYLWNDAFRYNRDKVFQPTYKTLEDLIDGFYKVGFGIFLQEAVKFDTAKAENKKVWDVYGSSTAGGSSSSGGSASTGTSISLTDRLASVKSSNPALYGLYTALCDEVKKIIPTLDVFSDYDDAGYACFRTQPQDHDKNYFTAIDFKVSKSKNRLDVFIYDPPTTKTHLHLGYNVRSVKPYLRPPCPYQIEMTASTDMNKVVEAIVESYIYAKSTFTTSKP